MGRIATWLAPLLAMLEEKAPKVHWFLTTEDRHMPLVRDVLGIVLFLAVLLGTIWGATGQSFPDEAPVVVIESGSMMHCANGIAIYDGAACEHESYGRIGTIDPGDLVFVKDTPSELNAARADLRTFAAGGKERFGGPGDTIVFQKNGLEGTPIIHRAMFWLQINADGTYTIPELQQTVSDPRDFVFDAIEMRFRGACQLTLPSVHGTPLGPEFSGFVTKGDNNACFDQSSGFLPVQPDWILGKARGELPWIGLLKLLVSGGGNYQNAPGDVKVMVWVTVAVFVGGPFVAERLARRFRPDED